MPFSSLRQLTIWLIQASRIERSRLNFLKSGICSLWNSKIQPQLNFTHCWGMLMVWKTLKSTILVWKYQSKTSSMQIPLRCKLIYSKQKKTSLLRNTRAKNSLLLNLRIFRKLLSTLTTKLRNWEMVLILWLPCSWEFSAKSVISHSTPLWFNILKVCLIKLQITSSQMLLGSGRKSMNTRQTHNLFNGNMFLAIMQSCLLTFSLRLQL